MNRSASSFPSLLALLPLLVGAPAFADTTSGATAPPIESISALAFAPDGTLFVGDARAGALLSIELGPREKREKATPIDLADVETKVAALVGARAEDVVIHDLAADPIAHDLYLAVSRNRGKWKIAWNLPNDLGDASELVRIRPDGRLEGVDLAKASWSRTSLPEPIAPGRKNPWKDVDLRTEAITDLAWDDGTLWVAGLSNQEFSSAIWRVRFPFTDAPAAITTVENYHVAHKKWETEAPVRTLLPLTLNGKKQLLAAYLCTPLVLFETEQLVDGAHVKGRTVSELGAGNYPLDLVAADTRRGPRIFLANSNLPLFLIDPVKLAAFEGALTEPVDSYTAGLAAEYRSGVGTQQMDVVGGTILVTLERAPSGALDLGSWQLAP